MGKPRRRQAGEGGISEYTTKARPPLPDQGPGPAGGRDQTRGPRLAAGEPVTVVSERLGHANATATLTVYQHVHPGMDRQAAERHAALLRG